MPSSADMPPKSSTHTHPTEISLVPPKGINHSSSPPYASPTSPSDTHTASVLPHHLSTNHHTGSFKKRTPPPSHAPWRQRCQASIMRILSWIDPRQHLAARLCWLIIIMVCVYLVVVVVTVDRVATDIVNKKTGDAFADLAYQTSNILDRVMYERWREAENIATLPQAYNNTGDDSLLDVLQLSYTDYAWIGITGVDGVVRASTKHLLHGVNVSARPWWIQAHKGTHVGDVHDALLLARLLPTLPNGDPQRFVDIACPLYVPAVAAVCSNVTDPVTNVTSTNCTNSIPKQFTGILGFHLSWMWASSIRDAALDASRTGDGVELFILDRDGTVLLGQERENGSDTQGVYAGMNLREMDSIQNAQLGETNYKYDHFVDGEYMTGYSMSRGYRTYPGLGWIVLVRQPKSDAIAPAVFLQRIILIVVLLVGLLLTALMTLALAMSIRPLQTIAHSADAITEQLLDRGLKRGRQRGSAKIGSLQPITVALPTTMRQDEVGHLGLSLSSLLSVLNAHRFELQNANAQLELKVQARTVELEMINRELEMFSQTVSHDLRAPLGSIRTSSELIQYDLTNARFDFTAAPTVTEYLTQIQSDVSTMTRLITDLLELSRINHSQMRIRRVDLAAIAADIVADLQRNNPERTPHVTVILPQSATPNAPSTSSTPPLTGTNSSAPNANAQSSSSAAAKNVPALNILLPPTDGKFITQADEGLVRVILTNLLSNAWKYSSKKNHSIIEFGYTTSLSDPPRRTIWYVRDNGAGFEMSHARRLFKPFQRMHSQSEFQGVGVGLSTVSRCCQRHGGRVWAKSAKNKGSTFFFTLESWDDISSSGTASDDGTGQGVLYSELPPLPPEERFMKSTPRDTDASLPIASPSSTVSLTPISPLISDDINVGRVVSDDSNIGIDHPVVRFHPFPVAGTPPLTPMLLPAPVPAPPSVTSASGALPIDPSSIQVLVDPLATVPLPHDPTSGPAFVAPQTLTSGATLSPSSSPATVTTSLLPASSTAALAPTVVTATSPPSALKKPTRLQKRSLTLKDDKPVTILFVDDSFINCKLGARILSSNGMLVDTANDGIDVLKLLYPGFQLDRDREDISTPSVDSEHSVGGLFPSQSASSTAFHDSLMPSGVVTHVSDEDRTGRSPLTPYIHPHRSLKLAKRYDLIFCDLTMPIMDGITCVSNLRLLDYPGRIIALTGHDDAAKRLECERVGFDGFLTKPFTSQQILDMIQTHAGRTTDYKHL